MDSSFDEATARRPVRSIPLAHLSVELGHLYFEDFAEGPGRLRQHFADVAPWLAAVRAIAQRALPGRTTRLSTCFLIDDYFGPRSRPPEILPDLLAAAEDAGTPIDYLARESACAEADGVPVAELVLGRVVADPPPGTDGSRPPTSESGWLSNGERSPGTHREAMAPQPRWQPPVENAATRHSIFMDVQLWDEPNPAVRRWSCAYLASVWQLLRLGLLRDRGLPVATPQPWQGGFPSEWGRLPAVTQLNPRAAPFSAYRTCSILHNRFLTTEHAVRTVLSQIAVEQPVADELVRRATAEGAAPPLEPVNRISYVFMA